MTAAEKRALKDLKTCVLEVLSEIPVPWESDKVRRLSELSNRVQCSFKARAVIIKPRRQFTLTCGTEIKEALEAAGLRVKYDIYTPQTEGRFVAGAGIDWISIPLDQNTGPFGYINA